MSLRTAGRKGALPNDPSRPRVNLGRALVPGAVAPPQAHWGHIPLIGMLGNDIWGDCVFAGAGHIIEGESFWGQGQEIELTTAEVLAGYITTGFDPSAGPSGANPTDNGSSLQAGLEYLVNPGFSGQTITMFGELDIKDTNGWQLALAQLGPLMLGVGVSDDAMQEFNAGEIWTADSQPADEDHCVILCGYQPGIYWCWTWGSIQGMTPGWFAQNAYEVWGAVTPEWVSRNTGKDPEGVSLAVLGQEYASVTGQPSPFPAVPAG